MNKLFTKIAKIFLGLSMATGVGVAVTDGKGVTGAKATAYTSSSPNEIAFNAASITGCSVNANGGTGYASSGGGQYQISSGATATINASRLFSNNEQLTTDLVGYVKVGTYSTWSNPKSVSFTIAILDSQNNVLSSNSGSKSGMSSTIAYSSGVTVPCPDDPSKIAQVRITFSSFNSGTTLRFNAAKFEYECAAPTIVDDWELTTGSLTITPPTDTVYYNNDTNNNISKTGAVIKANYWSASAHTTVKSETITDSNNLSWSLDLANQRVNLSYTEGGKTQTGSFSITVNDTKRPTLVSWDLTAASYNSASAATTTWTSSYVNMSWTQNGGTATNNYLPATRSYSRIYGQNICTFTAVSGYTIKKVVLTNPGTSNYGGLVGSWVADDDSDSTYTAVWDSSSKTTTIDLGSDSASKLAYTCTATTYLSAVTIFYEETVVIVPTKAVVSFSGSYGTYYSGSTLSQKYTFSTSHVVVNTYDDDNNLAESYSNGIGFKLTLAGETLDATSAVQTKSFLEVSAGSYEISVVVEGVGANQSNVDNEDQDPPLNLVVVAKDTTQLSWNNEQNDTFISYAQKLHIDGTFTPTWNDGSSTTSHSITTEVYTGDSAVEANKIYTASKAYATHNAGFDITAANVDKKTLSVDSEGRLAFSSATSLYVQMYYTQYPGAKIGKVINVVLPTLVVSDANNFNYYVGSQYNTAANAYLAYNNQNVRALTGEEFTLSPSSVEPVNTNSITVSATFNENESITNTYSITPKNPAQLEEIELYDATGAKMTTSSRVSAFAAGDTFKLYNKSGESYFALAMDEDTNLFYISSYSDFSFELLNAVDAVSGSGSSITSSTYIKKSMHNKWIRATYSQGTSSVDFTYQITVSDKTISTYTASTYGDYVKLSSSPTDYSGEYLIVYENTDSVQGHTNYLFDGTGGTDSGNIVSAPTITDGTIDDAATISNVAVTDYAVEISTYGDGYAVKVKKTGKYIYASADKKINYSDEKVELAITNDVIYGGSSATTSKLQFYVVKGSTATCKFYSSGQKTAYLYKRAVVPGTGSAVTYLKDVVDAFRLNNDVVTGSALSVCDSDSSIYSSDYWTGSNGKVSVKSVFNNLTSAELTSLSVQDTFGELGKTYVDTYNMLIENDPEARHVNTKFVLALFGESNSVAIIVIISMVSVSAIGGYFFLRKRREQN